MQAVVLAAGFGTRLAAVTRGGPKPLAEVGGRPLLAYVMENLNAAGVDEAIVVVGHHSKTIRAQLGGFVPDGMRVRVVTNPQPERGNGSSLLAAQPYLRDEPCLVAMADHLASRSLVRRLISAGDAGGNLLAVDYTAWVPAQIDDASKVLVDGQGVIRDLGKGLRKFNAIDTGFFVLQPDALRMADGIADELDVIELGSLARRLVKHPPGLHAVDVSGLFWIDVDCPSDFAFATDVLRVWSKRPRPVHPPAALN